MSTQAPLQNESIRGIESISKHLRLACAERLEIIARRGEVNIDDSNYILIAIGSSFDDQAKCLQNLYSKILQFGQCSIQFDKPTAFMLSAAARNLK